MWIPSLILNTLLLVLYSTECSAECKADADEPWTYRGKNGPSYWGNIKDAQCKGKKQSPIALSAKKAVKNDKLEALGFVNYDKAVTSGSMENTGHTVVVTPKDDVKRSINVDGKSYDLVQFHFHFGKKNSPGSEHTLEDKRLPAEVHFVHKNAETGALAVVGVFLQLTADKPSEYSAITNRLDQVPYHGDTKETASFIPSLMVPIQSPFFRYDGSLTTPPCTEGVTWSVIQRPIYVTKEEIAAFQKLFSSSKADAQPDCVMGGNFRPIQPLNGRKVYLAAPAS